MLNRLPLILVYSLCAFVLLFSACKSVKKTKEKCQGDEESCDGNMVNICLDDKWTILQDCSSSNMTCQMISGSAQCVESGGDIDTEGDVDTEVDSAVDDSDIGTDLEKVVSEPAASICNCVGKIFESKSGLDWIKDSCIANANESCLTCLEEKLGGRDCAELAPAATVLAMVECANSCSRSVTTMTDKNQCLEIVLDLNLPGSEEKTVEQFAECVCSKCFSSVQKCFSNHICPATLACLATPTGTCVDSECEQATPCDRVFETIFFLDESIYQIDDVNECVANKYNCYAYLGLYQETQWQIF